MFTVTEAKHEEQKLRLYGMRYEVFVHEQHKYKGTADHEKRLLRDPLDETAEHLCLLQNNEIVGSLRQIRGRSNATEAMWEQFGLEDFAVFPDEVFGFSGRLMLPQSERGSRGLLKLLHANYVRGREAGTTLDFIICNPHLVRLYEQLGYRRYRKHFFDPDHGYNVPMIFLAEDLQHLERIRSPFLSVARRWPAKPEYADWFQRQFPSYSAMVSPVVSPDSFIQQITEKLQTEETRLLAGLSQEEQNVLISESTRMHVDAGARIARKGDMGEELYLILDGLAEARIADQSGLGYYVVATFGQGDFFGELSVLTGNPRTNDVVALSALDVIFFDRATLLKFVKNNSTLGAKLLLNIAQDIALRLDATNTCKQEVAT